MPPLCSTDSCLGHTWWRIKMPRGGLTILFQHIPGVAECEMSQTIDKKGTVLQLHQVLARGQLAKAHQLWNYRSHPICPVKPPAEKRRSPSRPPLNPQSVHLCERHPTSSLPATPPFTMGREFAFRGCTASSCTGPTEPGKCHATLIASTSGHCASRARPQRSSGAYVVPPVPLVRSYSSKCSRRNASSCAFAPWIGLQWSTWSMCTFMSRFYLDTDRSYVLLSRVEHISTRSSSLGCPCLLASLPKSWRARSGRWAFASRSWCQDVSGSNQNRFGALCATGVQLRARGRDLYCTGILIAWSSWQCCSPCTGFDCCFRAGMCWSKWTTPQLLRTSTAKVGYAHIACHNSPASSGVSSGSSRCVPIHIPGELSRTYVLKWSIFAEWCTIFDHKHVVKILCGLYEAADFIQSDFALMHPWKDERFFLQQGIQGIIIGF